MGDSEGELFENARREEGAERRPLADRMRPRSLEEFVGQDHLLGPGKVLREAVEKGRLFSMILWGPPGCGKTALAQSLAQCTRSHWIAFSAVLSGIKEIREEQQRLAETARDFVDRTQIRSGKNADGTGFYTHEKPELLPGLTRDGEHGAFYLKEGEPAVYEWFRRHGLGGLFKETIHHSTFKAELSRLIEEGVQLPEEIKYTLRPKIVFTGNLPEEEA